jgi:nicotinate phosphoribosyltransferase
VNPLRQVALPAGSRCIDLRVIVMRDGVRCDWDENLNVMADRSARELALLPEGCLRFINPHRYKVSVTERLSRLKQQLLAEHDTGG